ncbi:MAG: Fe-S protein assembly co-chaperone HscB [Deltaproteobacteria bacterium]|nr:Fe-S protein assembly co-chaperone HscB [Deltaproteobacteria bacterium]
MTCWNCERDARDEAVCGFCGKLQPLARDADHFTVMGFSRRYAVLRDEVDTRFRELSRRFHPDRLARESAEERRIALQRTVALNDAYRVLRDDVKRGEYLLKLWGIDVGAEKSGQASAIGLGGGFLMEMLERREALLEARAAGDRGTEERLFAEAREARAAALERAAAGLDEEEEKGDRKEGAGPGAGAGADAGADAETGAVAVAGALAGEGAGRLGEVAREFARIRYYARFLGEAADD